MQDPSYGVAQPLQNHVHLISGHRYPSLQQISPEQVLTWLREAPQIVSKTASMAWVYVQPPSDGSIWLEWISPRNVENRYPSDGFLWGDPESSWQQEIGGYTMELLYHRVGYRPSYDQHATHARTRYHLIGKNPAINAASPDPSLYIVHYHQTDPGHVIPSPQVPVTNTMRQLLQERRSLEATGRIERREFMLHDREHWPTITMPGASHMHHPSQYPNPNMQMPQNRFPQMPGQYQAGPNGPAAKRQRFSGPGGSLPGPQEGIPDAGIDDEDYIALGDYFDHLSPREISLARYQQHHNWIEEVFSSPYASSRIIPPDLGLGLMGELKGLTDGLLEAPSLDEMARPAGRPPKAKEAQPFTNLKQEQVDEFNRRVEQHLEEGQAEIEKMKEEHAAKMAEWKKSKGIIEAEKRLRYATWEGHENAVPVHRVSIPLTNGGEADSQRPKETVEDVVKDVEALMGRKIGSHNDSTLIREGGLEKEEEQPKDQVMQDDDVGMFDMGADNAPSNDDQSSAVNNQSAISTAQQGDAQPPAQADVQPPADSAPSQPQPQQPEQTTNAMEDTTMGDTSMMGDMDLDTGLELDGVDFGDIDTGDVETGDNDAGNADNTADGNAPTAQVQVPTTDAPTTAETSLPAPNLTTTAEPAQSLSTQNPQSDQAPTSTEPSEPPVSAPPAAAPQPEQPSTTDTSLPATTTSNVPDANTTAVTTTNDPPIDDSSNLFDDNTFADLADMGSTGADGDDDGLIDFDGGMGLDDSAFGDAMHSMGGGDASNEQQDASGAGAGGETSGNGGGGGGEVS